MFLCDFTKNWSVVKQKRIWIKETSSFLHNNNSNVKYPSIIQPLNSFKWLVRLTFYKMFIWIVLQCILIMNCLFWYKKQIFHYVISQIFDSTHILYKHLVYQIIKFWNVIEGWYEIFVRPRLKQWAREINNTSPFLEDS